MRLGDPTLDTTKVKKTQTGDNLSQPFLERYKEIEEVRSRWERYLKK